jgi:hypothetical protein
MLGANKGPIKVKNIINMNKIWDIIMLLKRNKNKNAHLATQWATQTNSKNQCLGTKWFFCPCDVLLSTNLGT